MELLIYGSIVSGVVGIVATFLATGLKWSYARVADRCALVALGSFYLFAIGLVALIYLAQ